jgi:hypothetical protein
LCFVTKKSIHEEKMANKDSKLTGGEEKQSKRLFSILALTCLFICLPVARIASNRIDQGENLLGYGGLGIAISIMVAMLLSGVIFGQIALFRGEKPKALPISALVLNVLAFLFLLTELPG